MGKLEQAKQRILSTPDSSLTPSQLRMKRSWQDEDRRERMRANAKPSEKPKPKPKPKPKKAESKGSAGSIRGRKAKKDLLDSL